MLSIRRLQSRQLNINKSTTSDKIHIENRNLCPNELPVFTSHKERYINWMFSNLSCETRYRILPKEKEISFDQQVSRSASQSVSSAWVNLISCAGEILIFVEFFLLRYVQKTNHCNIKQFAYRIGCSCSR